MGKPKKFIGGFPIEILVYVARNVESEKDLSAFSQTCRYIHQATISTLYDRAKDDSTVMHWAVDKCRVKTIKYLLAAGADPDVPVQQDDPRASIHSLMREHQDLNIELLEMITIADKQNAIDIEAANTPAGEGDADGGCHDISEIMELDYTSLEDELCNYEDFSCSGSDACDLEDDSDDGWQHESGSDDEEDDDDNEPDDEDEEFDVSGYQVVNVPRDTTFPTRYYWTPLHAAARRGNKEIIALLLDHGANINALSHGYCRCSYPVAELPKDVPSPMHPLWTPLHTAICSGHYDAACFLLIRGASILVSTRGDGCVGNRVTALHSACYSGCTEFLKYLVQKRYQTSVNCEDHLGMTPMSYAYYAGNWDCIEWLAENGANLDARLGDMTLFKHACLYSRFYEAYRLVELGASMDYSLQPVERTALQCCCSQPYLRPDGRIRMARRALRQVNERESVVEMLLDAGASVKTSSPLLQTPLLQAAQAHMAGTVELLLAAGADPTDRDSNRYSPLILACVAKIASPKGDLLRTVKAVLPEEFSEDSITALRGLCANPVPHEDKAKVARLLLGHGASHYLKCVTSPHVLSRTVAYGNYELADLLLENGLPRPQPKDFLHILEVVVHEDNLKGVKYLTRKFRETSAVLRTGSLLYDAIRAPGGKCARFLIKLGTPIHHRGRQDGMTCLIHATLRKNTSVAKMLLDRGASPNEAARRVNFPLQIPIVKGDRRMINLLLDYGANLHELTAPASTTNAIEFAIGCNLTKALCIMVQHPAFLHATQKRRDEYILKILSTRPFMTEPSRALMLRYLIRYGGANPNVAWEHPSFTPLHYGLWSGHVAASYEIMVCGGDIHRKLRLGPWIRNAWNNTTPLEFAIGCRNLPVVMIEDMLEFSPLVNSCQVNADSGSESKSKSKSHSHPSSVVYCPETKALLRKDTLDIHALSIDYVRAACKRHRPDIFNMLFRRGSGRLDPNIRDRATGDTPLALLCATVENEQLVASTWNYTADVIAARTALCARELLRLGADPAVPNHAGVTPLDRVRLILDGGGSNEYSAQFASAWNKAFVIEDGDVLRDLGTGDDDAVWSQPLVFPEST